MNKASAGGVSKNARALSYYKDKTKRMNLKSKRKRNLVRKAIELTKMLDMDILMVLKDCDTGKISLYNSVLRGKEGGGDVATFFTIETAMAEIQALRA